MIHFCIYDNKSTLISFENRQGYAIPTPGGPCGCLTFAPGQLENHSSFS